ncbi:MAG TPA: hypothetical protein VG938_10655 [Verrucomicrobiae bacterium]|jgi:hypothetical protein|nr:hypothetical protein [Verrucomicrobiae bacterium]
MKAHLNLFILAAMLCVTASPAQESPPSAGPKTSDSYASDISIVIDSESQAVQQAKDALDQGEDPGTKAMLQTAITDMEKARTALEAAKNSPDKLGAALAAEQSAYQALLKATPHEFRISRSRSQSGGNSSGQPNPRQLDQLEMKNEENRYETERQASAAPTQQQREQSELATRLKELAQRQQDLNDRLRELQTALQAAKTDQEREDLQRQLKRLRDEERQMLADVDDMRQKMAQSPDAGSNAEARQQLDQTRSDVQRAAQEMEKDSPSQALASGTRAQQSMQNLREDLRRQTSSQFTDQMRQMRNQARDLAKQEDEIAKKLDSLQNGDQKSLNNTTDTQQLSDQLAKQQGALTNLLSEMRAVSEQSENIEPLLSQKLYDTLRRADGRHTDNLLEMGAQLAQRGFLPQTSEMEHVARTNINELRQGVESAAQSVLGNETDSLRYAQKELDDLIHQVQRETGAAGTNMAQAAAAGAGASGQSNRLASASGSRPSRGTSNREGTNSNATAQSGQAGSRESQPAGNDSPNGQRDAGNPANAQGGQQNGNQGEQASAQEAEGGQNGQRGNPANGEAQNRDASNPGQQANSQSPAGQNGSRPGGGDNAQSSGARTGGQPGDRERLSQLARQLGTRNFTDNGGGEGGGGPITSGEYMNWADRLRDVEQVLDSPDLRYQLATVRERASALRQEFRQSKRPPDEKVIREQLVAPMAQVRFWLQQELARQENANSLVPLDRDPVPDNYSELVRKYYEKLGSAQ